MTAAKVVYFTAGTIGAGHVVRGLAILRALEREGFRGSYTMVGPAGERPWLTEGRAEYRGVAIDPEELIDPERAPSSELARTLDLLAPDLLLVDLFWGPLVRLLPRRGCEAWLLLRRAPAAWLVGHARMRFERAAYARIVGIEPGADADEAIDPVVIADADDAMPERALRDRLGLAAGEPVHVVAHAGAPDEWRALLQRAPDAHVHVFTTHAAGADVPSRVRVHDGAALFPLAPWLSGASTITSGAGYNAFWEARVLGHAARTRFVPFARPIDDQAWRVRACATVTPRTNGAATLAAAIVGGGARAPRPDVWRGHAQQWQHIGPPLRPREEDTRVVATEAARWSDAHPGAKLRA